MSVDVSIVIPVYNMDFCIGDVLRALQQQSFPAERTEIIMVDDGSTDQSIARIEATALELGLRNLQVVSQKNAGPAAARNHGIRLAKAPIVVFLDSDCIPEPQWLEGMIAPMRAQPELAGVEGKTIPLGEISSPFDHYIDNPTGGNCWTCNIAYRRDWLMAAGGLDENLRWCEDIDLAYRMKRYGEIRFNPEAVVRHLILHWPFMKHLGIVRTFPYMIYAWKKNPGTVMPENSHFAQLLGHQLKSILWMPVNHRRWLFKKPLEYLKLLVMVMLWLIDTVIRIPYYYAVSKKEIQPREPLRSPARVEAP